MSCEYVARLYRESMQEFTKPTIILYFVSFISPFLSSVIHFSFPNYPQELKSVNCLQQLRLLRCSGRPSIQRSLASFRETYLMAACCLSRPDRGVTKFSLLLHWSWRCKACRVRAHSALIHNLLTTAPSVRCRWSPCTTSLLDGRKSWSSRLETGKMLGGQGAVHKQPHFSCCLPFSVF